MNSNRPPNTLLTVEAESATTSSALALSSTAPAASTDLTVSRVATTEMALMASQPHSMGALAPLTRSQARSGRRGRGSPSRPVDAASSSSTHYGAQLARWAADAARLPPEAIWHGARAPGVDLSGAAAAAVMRAEVR